MLKCWDMAPAVPHIYMSHEFMAIERCKYVVYIFG